MKIKNNDDILPIYVYGNSILRKVSLEIDKNYENLNELIDKMWKTLYQTDGIGLAAPQIGLSIRLFLIDSTSFENGFKKVFINPIIDNYYGESVEMEESCLSIPGISEIVNRKNIIDISYYDDENWNFFKETYSGVISRIIQHEYDHIEGKLFIDKLTPLRKHLIAGKLGKIINGKIEQKYRMIFK